MSLALTLAQWGTVGNTAIAVLALCLSGLALYLQRRRPWLEAHPFHDTKLGVMGVAVRNSGRGTAKAPWVLIAMKDQSVSFLGTVGPPFLGPEQGRLLLTDIPGPRRDWFGIVGHVDRKGRHIVRPMKGGRARRFAKGTFESMFQAFYGDHGLGRQGCQTAERPLP